MALGSAVTSATCANAIVDTIASGASYGVSNPLLGLNLYAQPLLPNVYSWVTAISQLAGTIRQPGRARSRLIS